MAATHTSASDAPPPLAPGLLPNVKFDVLSGFLVFLIAMPLCLGIARASQYPPIAGIWTAVIGGVLTTLISNAQLTIKGPAAGLIVVVAGAVTSLGQHAVTALPETEVAALRAKGKTDDEIKKELTARQLAAGYPLALGAALVAGVIQILFGLCGAGTLGELVPLAPVHGMLAAIGITILVKQLFPMLGMDAALATGTPMEIIGNLPQALTTIDPTIAAVGLTGLAILIAFPHVTAAVPALKPVPAQVIVLAVAVPLGVALSVKGTGLVSVPNILYSDDPRAALGTAFVFPKFDAIATGVGARVVVTFCLITSIESVLGSRAIDTIDPWRRKTDQNRDLLATGVGNTVCAAVGALPMIPEIVRSKANIDNGARTKCANLFHGLFLLAFVLLLPTVINNIPTAALGAMLVFVGFRLGSPEEFVHTYKIGPDQFAVFVTTILVTLSADLLVGVCSGIALKVALHLINGAPVRSLWRPDVEAAHSEGDRVAVLKVRSAAIFANWLGLRGAITKHFEWRDEVVLDLAATRLVDHSTMEKLHQLEREFAEAGKKLTVTGLDRHTPMSAHPLAARKGTGAKVPQGANPATVA